MLDPYQLCLPAEALPLASCQALRDLPLLDVYCGSFLPQPLGAWLHQTQNQRPPQPLSSGPRA